MVTFERAGKIVPRLMFQKPAEARAIHPDGLNNAGAFIHVPNPELTVSLMANFGQKKAHADLVSICTQWYVPPPKKMAPFVGIGDQAGRIKQVGLSKLVLEGAW
ncbi:DUF2026 family protein [Dechloromonas sp. ZY10]|uniref:DUF2026 family protein n=1 Tax=Dechloromonas aquae TaxID=2664436 RepID=UPI00352718AA